MSRFERPSEAASRGWANLQHQWQGTRDSWNDEVAARFEREFWSEWEGAVPQTIELLRALEEALDAAEDVANEE